LSYEGEWRLQKDEKVRVYALARELQMDSKDLIELCHQAGFKVNNQLSSLDADQRRIVETMARAHTGQKPPPPVVTLPAPPAPIPTLPKPIPHLTAPKPPVAQVQMPPAQAAPPPPLAPSPMPQPPTPPAPMAMPAKIPELTNKVRNLSPPKPRPAPPPGPQHGTEPPRPPDRRHDHRIARARSNAPNIATPPKPRAPLPTPRKEEKKPDEPVLKPIAKLSTETIREVREGAIKAHEAVKEMMGRGTAKEQEAVVVADDEDEEGGDRKVRAGAVKGREERHKKRSQRAKLRRDEETEGRVAVLDEEEERPLRLRQRIRHPVIKPGTQPRKGKFQLVLPITVRSLSEAIGVRANELQRKLMEGGEMFTINSALEPALALEMALAFGVELEIKKPLDPEEQLLEKLAGEDRPEDLAPRAPIVTVMGHVDHGKTSLLDRIRESNVVATEAGGITQHLRAWRVDHDGKPITFLDTPGHEAFTQMRARGAQVTDIVVLVVAADDGLMPQTEEAISHAKAAKVPIVVAINKVDLPNANLNRTRQQLYSAELIPDEMGGNAQFVETVATKDRARGIDQLLEKIVLVANYQLELKANPKKPGRGTCLEARVSGDEGVMATLLLQDGHLQRGDVVVCGCSYGRVRAMYDDLGRPIEEAGPTVPVRITGLDEAPNADDKFQVVPDLAMAREIAEKRRERQRAAVPVKNATFRLEDLDKTKVAEIKLILKADVRGSIEAIRKELEKLSHEEVRLNVLHTGIGAITEGDVQLALASPEDTLIIGFNVVPDDRARALAEDKGVQIKQYDIIYKLTDDLRSALEGKLKPHEEVIELGRAVVRQIFKISRVGTVAGCHVTKGTIERSARIRLIRDGVVIYPPPDRSATLDSLKRVKDDVREVREGFECGLKIAGYDDVKPGDVIEVFRIEQVQRTL
jgi:translation initiation factor IF-2